MASMMRFIGPGKRAKLSLKEQEAAARGSRGKERAPRNMHRSRLVGNVPFDGTNSALRVSQLCRKSIITELTERALAGGELSVSKKLKRQYFSARTSLFAGTFLNLFPVGCWEVAGRKCANLIAGAISNVLTSQTPGIAELHKGLLVRGGAIQ